MSSRITRRELLGTSLKAAAAAAVAPYILRNTTFAAEAKKSARDDSAAEKLGWRLSSQAYTLRSMTFFEALDCLAALGIKYVEMYPGQVISKDIKTKTGPGMSADEITAVKKKLTDVGIKAVCFGVTGSGKDTFEFAKKMGIETIVTEAHPDQFAQLDKLIEEFDINIALHNHPKPSFYWDPETVLKGIEGHSKRIGACADTGHWRRSGLEPIDCLKKLKGHIISLHFKDVVEVGKGGWGDVPWGTGKSDAKGMLAELKAQGFKGVFSIEYERTTGQELLDNMAKCVEFFDKTAAELSK